MTDRNLDDYRNCPDHMHIRQYVYLLNTCPTILAQEIAGRPIRFGGRALARISFPAKYAGDCTLCGAPFKIREQMMFGTDGVLGHPLCHGALAAQKMTVSESKRLRDASHARRRRAGSR